MISQNKFRLDQWSKLSEGTNRTMGHLEGEETSDKYQLTRFIHCEHDVNDQRRKKVLSLIFQSLTLLFWPGFQSNIDYYYSQFVKAEGIRIENDGNLSSIKLLYQAICLPGHVDRKGRPDSEQVFSLNIFH